MKITILGCGAAFPRPGTSCAGFLVENGSARVWLDAGNGTFSRLTTYYGYREVDAVVVSHSHSDHTVDLIPMMYALGFDADVQEPLTVLAPPDVPRGVSAGLGEGSLEIFQRVFRFREIAGLFEIGSLRFEPFRTYHPVETYGFRVSDGGGTFVYTADTAAYPGLAEACVGADLLLSEATFVRGDEAPDGLHLFAEEAGLLAAKAHVKRLVLTHIWGSVDPRVAVEQAAEVFHGPVEAAVEDAVYEL